MGLLDYISQKAKEIPDNAKAAYRGLLAAPEELAALFSPEMRQRVNQAMNTTATLDRDKAVGMAMDYLQTTPAGLLGHIVYHGSPHKFNKFDMSKIGSGEGAQAYGHGLYFSEAPAVADEYAGKLSDAFAYIGGKRIEHPSVVNALNTTQYGSKGDAVRNALDNLARFQPEEAYRIGYVDRFKTPIDIRDSGNLYKVDIPDEIIPRMLDWDRGLEQQSKEVRDAFMQMVPKPGTNAYFDDLLLAAPTKSGGYEYKAPLSRFYQGIGLGSHADLSQKLKQQGIPGIKYLDGMSRADGTGSYNYVLFDDQLPRILEVNGQPTGLLSYADEAAQKPKPKKAK